MRRIITLCLLVISSLAIAQESLPTIINVQSNTKLLEQLSSEYKSSLFAASNMDFNESSKNWRHLLSAMETYAQKIQFELNGVKLWMKCFFDKDGQIDYITYFLMDKSINVDKTDLEAFLRSFIKNYKLPISHKSKFSYDSRVQFPIYMMR